MADDFVLLGSAISMQSADSRAKRKDFYTYDWRWLRLSCRRNKIAVRPQKLTVTQAEEVPKK